jgi:hypothetical protein
MGSDVSFADLARKLRAFGVVVDDSTGSSHVNITRVVGGLTLPYSFPKTGGQHVKHIYIRKIKRR